MLQYTIYSVQLVVPPMLYIILSVSHTVVPGINSAGVGKERRTLVGTG